MREFEICECTPLEDTLFCCSPVRLPDTELLAVYLGPSGAFIHAAEDCDPLSLCAFLREFFRTARIGLYVSGKGLYSFPTASFEPPLSEELLDDAIYRQTTLGIPIWDEMELQHLQERLCLLDGQNRGLYRTPDGEWLIARNGKFYPMSEHDPDRIMYLALFGGILGLHRFALGKWFSGLLYALTGALIGFGWLLDIMQLTTGTMQDGESRLLAPPERIGVLLYLAGLASGIALFSLYIAAAGLGAASLDVLMRQSVQHASLEQFSWLTDLIRHLAN